MSQTTGTGAKKIQDADNWRDIFDIHNNTVDAYDGKIGTTSLPTTAQTLTGAVAEHETDITGVNNKIGSTTLPTTAQTLTGAIDEHESDISALNSKFVREVLLTSSSTWTTEEHEYALAHPVTDYLLVSIQMSWGTKPIGEKLMDAGAFVSAETMTLKDYGNAITFTIGERTASSIKVRSTNGSGLLSVFGIMKK